MTKEVKKTQATRQQKTTNQKIKTFYKRLSNDDKEIERLRQVLAERIKQRQVNKGKNKQYLAMRVFENFFEKSLLGKIFKYNEGELFADDTKVELVQEYFAEIAEKIKNEPLFELTDVDFDTEENVDFDEENTDTVEDDEISEDETTETETRVTQDVYTDEEDDENGQW